MDLYKRNSFKFLLVLLLTFKSTNALLNLGSGGLSLTSFFERLGALNPLEIFQRTQNPDIALPAPALITKAGYPVESHEITTQDGYILTIHRIPFGRNNTSTANRPVALLQHGILSSSDDWILNGPRSLAYRLADEGYDVWLMNSRGNKYSRKHLTLTPQRMPFWEFGYNEMGIYDLPAVIDMALNRTGQSTLNFIGHNIAASKLLALLSNSTLNRYNDRIRLASIMGPTVFGNNMRSPLRFLGPFTFLESAFLDFIGNGELVPELLVQLLSRITPSVCTPILVAGSICESPIYLFAGFDSAQANFTLLPVILGHRTSTSTRTFIHFIQSIIAPTFRQYDYGTVRNRRIYGQTLPPDYAIRNATVPFALYWGDNDLLADTRDVARLAAELPNVRVNRMVENRRWNNIDYLFGIDADPVVYTPLIADLTR